MPAPPKDRPGTPGGKPTGGGADGGDPAPGSRRDPGSYKGAPDGKPGAGSTPGGGGSDKPSGYGERTPDNPDGITARHGSFGPGASPESTTPNKADINTHNAHKDYRGDGDSLLDKVGNFIARAFGFSEVNPYDGSAPQATGDDAPSVTGDASWAVDPIGLALGIGGLANPIIGIAGHLYNGIKGLTGWTGPQIALDGGGGIPGGPPDKQGDTGGNALVGIDKGISRPTSLAQPKGVTAATPAPAPAAVPELLTGVTGRNRNYTSLLSPTPTAEAL